MITSTSYLTPLSRGFQFLKEAAHIAYVSSGAAKYSSVVESEGVQLGLDLLQLGSEMHPAIFTFYAVLVFISTAAKLMKVLSAFFWGNGKG